MQLDQIKMEGLNLLRSFAGAVAAAACLAALNWIGAHIPSAVQFIGTLAGAYGGIKVHSVG